MKNIYSPVPKVLIFTGNFGSGKSEIAVNYTLFLNEKNSNTTIIDLDIIKPYFRCREATELLRRKGVRVVIPEGERRYADLPILVPEIKGLIQSPSGYTILDVGGEDTGARVLSYFQEAFQVLDQYELFLVVNRNRPFTGDLDGVLKMLGMIEKASGLKVTHLISNNHLLEETDLDTVVSGYELTKAASEKTGIPIFLVGVPDHLMEKAQEKIPDTPLLSIQRILLPPHLMHKKARWLV
ncbi:MAG: hypothetical protein HUU50_07845 [Candidatus Brocadiae bacterium]|nr:hypothetical protein [Candidatus Brocadiia bacterium]